MDKLSYLLPYVGDQDRQWMNDRMGMITASEIHYVMAKKTTKKYNGYIERKAFERVYGLQVDQFYSPEMSEGHRSEDVARKIYEMLEFPQILNVGFIPHIDPEFREFSGASPDGIVVLDNVKLLEIKVVGDSTFYKVDEGKVPTNHFLQMQWQMDCTGLDECDYVVMHRLKDLVHIRTVEKDSDMIASIRERVKEANDEIEELIRSWRSEHST